MKNIKQLDKNILVKVSNLSMSFKIPEYKYDTLKEHVINFFKGKRNKYKTLQVLDNINFELKKGESLGIIGHNGAGKSTLLKLIAGTYLPTEGTVQTNGDVVLLNFGIGFDIEANAEENIFLNGALLGITRKQMKNRIKSIIEFAELDNYQKMPIKNFSSGMISRLGFAIAMELKPDVLLIDEVLSVGDVNFQKKCAEKIKDLISYGTSFVLVSHNTAQIENFCQKTLWIENSKVVAYGDSKKICNDYLDYCNQLFKKID